MISYLRRRPSSTKVHWHHHNNEWRELIVYPRTSPCGLAGSVVARSCSMSVAIFTAILEGFKINSPLILSRSANGAIQQVKVNPRDSLQAEPQSRIGSSERQQIVCSGVGGLPVKSIYASCGNLRSGPFVDNSSSPNGREIVDQPPSKIRSAFLRRSLARPC